MIVGLVILTVLLAAGGAVLGVRHHRRRRVERARDAVAKWMEGDVKRASTDAERSAVLTRWNPYRTDLEVANLVRRRLR